MERVADDENLAAVWPNFRRPVSPIVCSPA
jgi:hypothetical protein